MQIIPAILTNNAIELDDLLQQIKNSQKFARVQIDFIDNNPQTIISDLLLDAHVMTTKKIDLSYFDRVVPQIEIISNPQDYKCLAVDLDTPIEIVKPYLLNLDLVLVMAVKYGQGGQIFNERVLPKIAWLKEHNMRICVDGGVTPELLPKLEELGVDEVAAGAARVLSWK